MTCELYCCLLPHCEALRTCRSGFPIATAYFVTDIENLDKDHVALSQQNCWKELHRFKKGINLSLRFGIVFLILLDT